jgi:hypothetical protein
MTAEVIVMNKSAVALAADSAMSTGQESGQKIFNTANKLFALSKYRPVGVMIYGNSEFMVTPWETIIKYYRSQLHKKKSPHLREYAEDFISFLQRENHIFWPPPIQEQYFLNTITGYFQFVREQIENKVKESLSAGKPLTEEQIKTIVSSIVKDQRDELDLTPSLPTIPDNHSAEIANTYQNQIQAAITNVFQSLPLQETAIADLQAIAAQLFCKNKFPNDFSGLVVAGFGEDEIFPSFASFKLDAVIKGKLKYTETAFNTVSRDVQAIIMPFAQSEMVSTFIEGIDPNFKQMITAYLKEFITDYPRQIVDAIPKISHKKREQLAASLDQTAAQVLNDFERKIKLYIDELHIQPVMNAVAALPKDELAAMAEALVNLTSFKRKVTLEAETVGGPIDVAVISKGDGFIWIKRKHYFKPELNKAFFANYYREDIDEQVHESQ